MVHINKHRNVEGMKTKSERNKERSNGILEGKVRFELMLVSYAIKRQEFDNPIPLMHRVLIGNKLLRIRIPQKFL